MATRRSQQVMPIRGGAQLLLSDSQDAAWDFGDVRWEHGNG